MSASGGDVGAISGSAAGARSRRADIDAVVEVQLPHDFQERRDRLQVSLLQRNVGAAQRLGQPRDLEAGIVLRRIEPPLRQGLTDSATNRRRALLCVARNLLDAVARHEQVEIRLSPLDQHLAEDFAQARLRARSEAGFGSLGMSSSGFWRGPNLPGVFSVGRRRRRLRSRHHFVGATTRPRIAFVSAISRMMTTPGAIKRHGAHRWNNACHDESGRMRSRQRELGAASVELCEAPGRHCEPRHTSRTRRWLEGLCPDSPVPN